MDAAAELGRNPVSKQQIQPEYGDELMYDNAKLAPTSYYTQAMSSCMYPSIHCEITIEQHNISFIN